MSVALMEEEEKLKKAEEERVRRVLEELRSEMPMTVKAFGSEFERRTKCELMYHEVSAMLAYLNAVRVKVGDAEIIIERDYDEDWVAYCDWATVPIKVKVALMKTPEHDFILYYDYKILNIEDILK
jgi:hypothetical protein